MVVGGFVAAVEDVSVGVVGEYVAVVGLIVGVVSVAVVTGQDSTGVTPPPGV